MNNTIKNQPFSGTAESVTLMNQLKDTCLLLSLLISTKILNSYILLTSVKTKHEENRVLQAFKDMIRELKDLSYISQRYTIVEGKLSSREIRYMEKEELRDKLEKLDKIKTTLEENVFG